MDSNELVKMLDNFMGNEGYYLKPQVENGKVDFVMGESSDASSDSQKNYDAVGTADNKKAELFTATPKVDCPMCADIPNLFENEKE